jgi:hypothetical protein
MKLVEREVIDRDPFAFASDMDHYSAVQTYLKKSLKTESNSVLLVGSGATGYSIAPDNFARPFHARSDFDFAIISPKLFDQAWSELLKWGHPIRHRVPQEAQNWFNDRRDEIFWGWLDPKYLSFRGATRPETLRALRGLKTTWFDTFKGLGAEFPGRDIATRDAGARLYRSRMHLLHYQANGLRRVRSDLIREQ